MSETAPSSAVFTSYLRASRIRFAVRLGWTEEERALPQPVEVDFTCFFPSLIPATLHDKGDFICYDEVSRMMSEHCKGREFRLIEYLAKELFDIVRRHAPPEVKLTLRLSKCEVPSVVAMSSASFTLSDVPPFSWTPPL